MKRSYSSSLQHFVATTITTSSGSARTRTSMNFTSRHRGGGRRQFARDFSDQNTSGRGLVQDVDLSFQGDGGHSPSQTGSQPHAFNGRRPFNHHQSFRQPSPHNQGQFFRPPPVQAQSFQYPPPSSYHQTRQYPQQDYNHNRRIYRPPPNVQVQQHSQPQQQNPVPDHSLFHPPPYNQNSSAGPAQQRAQRPPRDLVYRNWEFARTAVPSDCKRFVVLSYNLLADYLAINHKSQLYFHIPHYMLEWNWRKKNIIFELGLWSADIMCLQEVDRFEELEKELKLRGYCGIWKMRTGEPVDGCAIFWRTSRFKLLHEESVEFLELGMRNNVAQLCVLELINEDKTEDRAHLPHTTTSTACAEKIVLCNIHVLYNPKRGDIKLGQIRVLLEKAYTISKAWDDAPVVLCGDFNCTPKSPLYNFISEQKLSLSGLDRDKVSGQASAEIYAPSPNFRNNRNQPSNTPTQAPVKIDISDECRSTSASAESVPPIDISNQNEKDESCTNKQDAAENDDTTGDRVDPESVGSLDLSSSIIKNSSGEKEFCFDDSMDKKMEDLSLNEPVESNMEMEGGSKSEFEDDTTFVAALHNLEDPNMQLSGGFPDERQVIYDPRLWTPETISIATGHQDCLDLEHKLKLKSTYTEVEDISRTRDANGEPLVTSYHRRFMGTVDYIWRSEGLQTVRTLAPIPKTPMQQWTPGFPTKKWGSDHIALVTELAFVRGKADEEAEVQ